MAAFMAALMAAFMMDIVCPVMGFGLALRGYYFTASPSKKWTDLGENIELVDIGNSHV